MYDSRSDELGAHSADKYYRYEGQQYEPYTTIMGQSGLPLNIPYGLFQYAKYQEDPRNVKVKDTLRRGKWTVRNLLIYCLTIPTINLIEENLYRCVNRTKSSFSRDLSQQDEEVKLTDRIIETFNAGSLELDPETAGGVTLRSYLSEKLGCDPMRITKKYTGASCLGKRVYHSANTKAPREVVEAVKIELAYLEEKFREKLEKNCRDRLGLEADVDKHLRNQVVSTPSIDAMMMQGGSSGPRKGGVSVSVPPNNMLSQGSSNMGYWTMPQPPLIPMHIHASSSSTPSSNMTSQSLSIALPSYRDQDNHDYEYGIKTISPSEYSSDKYSLKDPSKELTTFESMISSIETAIGCEKVVKPIAIKSGESSNNNDNVNGDSFQEVAIPRSHPVSASHKSNRRVVPHFPYSRYHDPISPVSASSSKGGFELSASSYYYAPSAQEVEANKVQQQKQQQHHMLLLQQQQQQQNQQYYLSLQKSSDHPSVPKKTNMTTHCVPTLANIGGVKRKDNCEGQKMSLSESQTKMHKIENINMRNRNDLPIEAFLKSGNIHCGTAGYQSIKGHGQGMLLTFIMSSQIISISNYYGYDQIIFIPGNETGEV